jgi:hypothetical protein
MRSLRCATCEFFEEDSNIRVAGTVDKSVVAGTCLVDPPTVHLMPVAMPARSMFDVESGGAQQMALAPHAFERIILNTRGACARYEARDKH